MYIYIYMCIFFLPAGAIGAAFLACFFCIEVSGKRACEK